MVRRIGNIRKNLIVRNYYILVTVILLAFCLTPDTSVAMTPQRQASLKSNQSTTKNSVNLPQFDTVTTGTLSLVLGVNGRFGAGGNGGTSGVRMDYYYFPPECDTVDSIPGNTEYYLYDGSVFIGRIVNGDTIVSNMFFGNNPNDPTTFLPLTNQSFPTIDGVVQNWRSGTISNADTTIGMVTTYYAPQNTVIYDFGPGKNWKTDEQFITRELKVWSLDGLPHDNIAVGEVVDWDVPTDSGADNTGEVDETRNLLYCVGGEYNQDDSIECQDNNLRYGGMAFGYFKRFVAHQDTMAWFIVDSVPYGGYHESNSRYMFGNSWNDNELYYNIARYDGLNSWSHSHVDSQLVDLHSVLTYVFEYDLKPGDTLVFYSVLTTVRNAEAENIGDPLSRIGILADKGRNFVRYFGCCHNLRGDLNTDGTDGDIVDLTFLVSVIFRGGPPPTCACEGDVNADGTPSNILDLSFLVDKLFRGGPPPYSCGEAPCNTSGCHNN